MVLFKWGALQEGISKTPAVSSRQMRKLFEQVGYCIAPGRGKGSHWVLKKEGRPTIMIPNDKALPRGLSNRLWKLLKEEEAIEELRNKTLNKK